MAKIETKLGHNYIDAVSGIQSSLDQLKVEVADNKEAVTRIENIKKALAEITPERSDNDGE